jgi:hypothetical protein
MPISNGKGELNEYEWLLPPAEYFMVTDIKKYNIFGKIFKIVNLKLIMQDHYTFDLTNPYIKKNINVTQLPDFHDDVTTIFVNKMKHSIKLIENNKLVKNKVSSSMFYFLWDNYHVIKNYDQFMNDIVKINTKSKKFIESYKQVLTKYNATDFALEFFYGNKKLDDVAMNKMTTKFIDLKKHLKLFDVTKLKLTKLNKPIYSGISDEEIYKKLIDHKLDIISCSFDKSGYLHDSFYNNFYPNMYLNKKLDYIKYFIKIKMKNKKIQMFCVDNPTDYYDGYFILVSLENGYEIKSIKKSKNKYGLPIKIITIKLL